MKPVSLTVLQHATMVGFEDEDDATVTRYYKLTPKLRLMDGNKLVGQLKKADFERLDAQRHRNSVTEAPPSGYTFTSNQINRDALKQDTMWYDRKAKEYKIVEMSKWHAYHSAKKLRKQFGTACLNTPLHKALIKQWRTGRILKTTG